MKKGRYWFSVTMGREKYKGRKYRKTDLAIYSIARNTF